MDIREYIDSNEKIAEKYFDSIENENGKIIFVKLYKGDYESLSGIVSNLSLFFSVRHYEDNIPTDDNESERFGLLHLDITSDIGASDEVFMYPGHYIAVSSSLNNETDDVKFAFSMFNMPAGDRLCELCREKNAEDLLDELFGKESGACSCCNGGEDVE